MTIGWNENASRTVYMHKHNPKMVVRIIQTKDPVNAKYLVYHTHPGFGGVIIPQKTERANTMERARKLVNLHMQHWNDSAKWSTDPDFGKAN